MKKKNKFKIKKNFEWFFKFTDKDLEKFSKLSGDNHPIHLKKSFAQKKGLENKVIYGALLASQVSKLIGNKINYKNVMMIGFDIKFNYPAYVNENLKFIAELKNFSKSVSLMTFKFIVKNSKNKKICQGSVEAITK